MESQQPWKLVADAICDGIRSGRWPVGAAIPSTAQLARTHGVARGTVQRAVGELKRARILVGKVGSRVEVVRVPDPGERVPASELEVFRADLDDLRARVERLERRERPDA